MLYLAVYLIFMKFIFHGGAKEVGKSCIELITNGNRYLLDAGLKFKEHGFEAPFKVFDLPHIDGLFLSHAHLDHTGSLPLFEHFNLICPIYCTQQTRELTKILLKDSYKIARIKHLHPAYQKPDLKKVYAATNIVNFDKEYTAQGITFKFLNAGHIPGSAMILIKTEGKKILYTGDFKLSTTKLMTGARDSSQKYLTNGDLKDIDILISESTYGDKTLPERAPLEEHFLDRVAEVTQQGAVVIPVFSLGRAQEILIILAKRKWNVPIYFDGMCVDMTDIILKKDPSYLTGTATLRQMFRKVTLVRQEQQRQKIMNQRAIFITTSGMVQGGPVMEYIENIWGDPNNAIFLTGFQCKRTNGRTLVDEGYLYLKGWKTTVRCAVEKFDFSGHSDDAELKTFVNLLKPKIVIFQHGDEDAVNNLCTWAEQEGYRTYGPAVGHEIDL